MTAAPVFTRMYQVQDRYGVSDDTVYRWERQGLLTVLRRGRISGVRHDEMMKVLESSCGATCGAAESSGD
jgi:predicted site-specific integrase-resolvase